jgi:pimeloyl-ACP methyl ester carboxylesterase
MRAANLTCSALLILVMNLSGSIATAQTGNAASPPPPPLGKLVDVGAYRVHLYCTGTGGPPVIIAGAGYSFDWGLIQPEVAKFTQVCTYDHSGIGWSDPGPADSCALRVREVHTALQNLGVKGPYVLVGHSLGALVVRLYAAQYPDEVAGVVFADHAFMPRLPQPHRLTVPQLVSPAPKPHEPAPVFIGMESDPNFKKLPTQDQQLHLWAAAQGRDQVAMQANMHMAPQCADEADAVAKQHPNPLGDKPLVDISIENEILGYAELQSELLALSRDSNQIVARNSSHFIIIDRPDLVVEGIRQLVDAARAIGKLSGSTQVVDHSLP